MDHPAPWRAIDLMPGPSDPAERRRAELTAFIERFRRLNRWPDPETSFGCSGPCCNPGTGAPVYSP